METGFIYQRMSTAPDLGDREKVELFISCRNLKMPQVREYQATYRSDILVRMHIADDRGQFNFFGQTEIVKESLSPDFTKTFILDYIFEKKQAIKFEVVNIEGPASFELIGEIVTSLGQLVGSRDGTSVLDLRDPVTATDKSGKMIVRVEQVGSNRDFLRMKWKASNLTEVGNWFARASPFIRVLRVRQDGSWLKIYESEVIRENLNPQWKAFDVKAQRLCNGDYNLPLKVEVWSYTIDGNHKPMGEVTFTMNTVINGKKREFHLINSKQKNTGSLILDEFMVENRPEFLDFIQGGTQIAVIVAVDFTASNGTPTNPNSLHALYSNGYYNHYQQAINQVCEILLNYDYDKTIPMYGFGAKPQFPDYKSGDTQHCFPLTGKITNPEVHGLEGILQTYAYALKNVDLNGPTYFGPVLKEASRVAEDYKKANDDVYIVLLILTDGELHDMDVSKSLLVDAGLLPLSVIIVGIGNADFSKMKVLDGDDGLTDFKGRSALRDLVQFVPFNSFRNNPMMLAEEVLAELPDQLIQYKKMVDQKPGPSKIKSIKSLEYIPDVKVDLPLPPPSPQRADTLKNISIAEGAKDTGPKTSVKHQVLNPFSFRQ